MSSCFLPLPADSVRSYATNCLATLLLLSAPTLGWGQATLSPPSEARPSEARSSEDIQIAEEALPAAADEAMAKGRDLEARGLWHEAVANYEEAMREFPADRRLKRRFDLARLHSSLERRYADASFVEMVRAIDSRSSADLYTELLAKIQSHYVVTPPWRRIVEQGATAVLIAAADPSFAARHGVRPSEQQLHSLSQAVRKHLADRTTIRSAQDVLRLADEIARMAEYRVGAPEGAWTMEFVAAAAGGLDHYSSFLSPGQLRDVYAQIEGNFVGLGVELKADDGALLIVRVIPNSPAKRAGIVAGDRIIAVDGQATAELSTDEAASLLTGKEGTVANVTVVSATKNNPDRTNGDVAHLVAKPVGNQPIFNRSANTHSRVLAVRREHVEVPSLEASRIIDADYGVAYVRIPVFQKTTARDLESSLWDLHRQGMRSLVIDLRGNPGGLLTASVELSDKFVAQGNIVSTRGRSDGEDFDYRAHRAGTWRVPLVVMIDGDSASASEIFAAAIRDNRRGTIVGTRSFGKGSVQGIFPMAQSGVGIRLTTAKFFSPKGHPISKVGVNPDIVVRQATRLADGTEESQEGRQTVGYRGVSEEKPESDLALTRAVETARQQVAMR